GMPCPAGPINASMLAASSGWACRSSQRGLLLHGHLFCGRGRNILMVGAGLAEVPPGCDSGWSNSRLEWVGCSHCGNGPPQIFTVTSGPCLGASCEAGVLV